MARNSRRSTGPYDFNQSVRQGENAVDEVLTFLSSPVCQEHWQLVKDVETYEKNPFYQKVDIDLMACVRTPQGLAPHHIEVKGDRNDSSGNFFIETVSDVARNTLGAFLICEAHSYFYYFFNTQRLYCIPLKPAQEWFLCRRELFQERTVKSTNGNRNWRTTGSLVPISTLIQGVPKVGIFQKRDRNWIVSSATMLTNKF